MRRLTHILAVWCSTLLLAHTPATAATVVWSDNFDTNAASRWQYSTPWKIGLPTAGPAAGSRTHSGADCAYTQGYGYNVDTRLVCESYNGATTLLVPAADQMPRLRFWHWFNFGNALGYVEISANGGAWTQVSPTYLDINGGGVWSRPYIDLSAYAGENVQIAFHFTSGGCCGNGLGWYVDDVEVDAGAPVLSFPEGFESDPKTNDWSEDFGTWEIGRPTSGPGEAHSGTNCAATVLAGNYANNVDSRLISPQFQVPLAAQAALHFAQWYSFNNALGFVEVNNGTLSTATVTNTTITTNAVASGLNTNLYQLFGAAITNYSAPLYWNQTIGGWTNATKALGSVLDVTYGQYFYEAGSAPLVVVGLGGAYLDYRSTNQPAPLSLTPTNFLTLQGMTWNSVTSSSDNPVGYFGTNYTYTYTTNTTVVTSDITWVQISPTYKNATSGGWTNTTLDLSAYAGQAVQLAFHFTSGGVDAAPGWYVDDISLGNPPVLTVPATQTNYFGQSLTVTNVASNPYATNSVFTFGLVSTNPPGVALDPDSGILTWPAGLTTAGKYTVVVSVTDSVSGFSATNSFLVVESGPPPPTLEVPARQTLYPGQTLSVTNTAASVYGAETTFTFALLAGLTDPAAGLDVSGLADNGVLTWVTETNLARGNYTNKVSVTDNVSGLSATNSFVVAVSNAPPPTLYVPAKQTIYAGQTLTVAAAAASVFGADSVFTFTLLAGLTSPASGFDSPGFATNGILSWATMTSLAKGSYTNEISVLDSMSGLSATNSFVIVVSNTPPPPTLNVPPKQSIYAGQTLTVTNTASSVFGTNSTFTFALLAGLTNPAAGWNSSGFATDGVLSWATTTALAAGNYTNKVSVTDGVSGLSATNSFVVVVSNTPPPTLNVPAKQAIFAGQRLTVTNTAASIFGTNSTFTFALLAGLTNPAAGWNPSGFATDGVLSWATTTALAAGNYTNKVSVTDGVSGLSATNSFVVVVSNTPPPTLNAPARPLIYAGQTLTVTNIASSVFGTNSVFTYELLAGMTNLAAGLNQSGFATNGVLSWSTTTNLAAGDYTNIISVADGYTQLSATNSFVIAVSNPPPPTLTTLAPALAIYAGQTWTATNTAASVYTNSVFTFTLFSGPVNVDVSTNGILRWPTAVTQPPGNYTNLIVVLDSVSELTASNSFVVAVSSNAAPPPPSLASLPVQTIYAGQTLMVTNAATNSLYPDCTFTFGLLPPVLAGAAVVTNTGVLTWPTTVAQPVGTYTNILTVSDSVSRLSATNQVLVQVLPAQPPTLIVPATQLIFAGQPLVVTNYATSVYPGDTFTFAAFGPTNLDLSSLPALGVIKWTPTAAQAETENTIYVQVTDSNSLHSISNFIVLVVTTPSPALTVPPVLKPFADNGFRFTLSTEPGTSWRIEASSNLLNWATVATNLASPAGTLQVTDLLATNYLRRFYRAVLP